MVKMRNVLFFNFKSLENRMSFLPIIPVEYTAHTHIYIYIYKIKRERWKAWRHQIFLNSIQKRTIEGLQKFSYLSFLYNPYTVLSFLCPGLGDVFGGSLSFLNLKINTSAFCTKELAARRSSLYLKNDTWFYLLLA